MQSVGGDYIRFCCCRVQRSISGEHLRAPITKLRASPRPTPRSRRGSRGRRRRATRPSAVPEEDRQEAGPEGDEDCRGVDVQGETGAETVAEIDGGRTCHPSQLDDELVRSESRQAGC